MTTPLPINGRDRVSYGFILQALGPGGERRWWVRRAAGGARTPDATMTSLLREVTDELDALPGEWRVETISTPATIYRDLQGTRRSLESGPGGDARHGHANEDFRPEREMLGSIGRLDLLAAPAPARGSALLTP